MTKTERFGGFVIDSGHTKSEPYEIATAIVENSSRQSSTVLQPARSGIEHAELRQEKGERFIRRFVSLV